MNIFKVLSLGNGSIQETNVTAFLSYLLDPNEGHGLNSNFLELFLSPTVLNNKEKFKDLIYENRITDLSYKSRFSVSVLAEEGVFCENNESRFLDILIEIRQGSEEVPLYVFCVENKIKDGAIQEGQLADQIVGLYNRYKDDNKKFPTISMIYLTKDNSEASKRSFSNFIDEIPKRKIGNTEIVSNKYFWNNEIEESLKEFSVFNHLGTLIKYDEEARIDPIHDYTKFTIKSFLNFVSSGFKSYQEEKAETNQKNKYGKPVYEYFKSLYDSLEDSQNISVKDAKKYVSDNIIRESGKELPQNTLTCQMYMVTVNDKNRIHYYVKNPDSVKNLFYYTDSEKKFLSKYIKEEHFNIVDVYWGSKDDLQCSRNIQE